MNELFPIISGPLVGSLLTLIKPQMRLAAGVIASVVLGTSATEVVPKPRSQPGVPRPRAAPVALKIPELVASS